MKILLAASLYPPEIGGPATYAKLLEDELPRRGIEVSVLPFRAVRYLPPVVRHLEYAWKLLRIARNMDLILVQDTVSTGLPVALVSLFMRKKFVLRVPGDYAWEQGTQRLGVTDSLDDFQKCSYGLFIGILRAIQRFTVSRATKVIAPSKYLGSIVSSWVPTKHIDVIYNGVAIGGKLSARKKENHIVSSGRLVPWKGFKELIDVVSKHPEWQLRIFGDGPQRAELEDRMWHTSGEKHTALPGSVSRGALLQAFAEASVFVLNSRYEGLSHTLVEAMSVGTPVIATRIGGNPEVVEDGVNGTLIDVGDARALEEALIRLLSDEELRTKLGRAAAERAKDFSIEKTVEATASLLKTCTSSH